ncbi:hypothetical protein I4U23_004769 [Adineta vaga]|nr:hypothetical protein I4U23_004769 [Adineta vaga]
MKENYSTVTPIPIIDHLNVDDLKNFLQVIEYSNLSMNLYANNSDEDCGSEIISDLSIILDRNTTPPFFCMVQYYGAENELDGETRNFEPQLMFIYDFDKKWWDIIDNRSSDFQSSHISKMLNQFNPSTGNLQQLKDQIMNCLRSIED